MKYWLKIFAVATVAVVFVVGFDATRQRSPQGRYARIQNGMTIDEVELVIGRKPDSEVGGESWPLCQIWTFRRWGGEPLVLEVEYDRNGRVFSKNLFKKHPGKVSRVLS